jgi:hypothetical protein
MCLRLLCLSIIRFYSFYYFIIMATAMNRKPLPRAPRAPSAAAVIWPIGPTNKKNKNNNNNHNNNSKSNSRAVRSCHLNRDRKKQWPTVYVFPGSGSSSSKHSQLVKRSHDTAFTTTSVSDMQKSFRD